MKTRGKLYIAARHCIILLCGRLSSLMLISQVPRIIMGVAEALSCGHCDPTVNPIHMRNTCMLL